MWTNLHVVDNHSLPATRGLSRKVKPVLDTLGRTFLQCYNHSQQLAVDEGMVKYKGRVKVKELLEPFAGINHLLYCDNYYSSRRLLAKNDSIYAAATIKRNAKGFPESLKSRQYKKESMFAKNYMMSATHFIVTICFVTNAFPEHLVPRLQKDGVLHRECPCSVTSL